MITENLSTLKINKLTQAQYDRELANGTIDETALYLTPDEETNLCINMTPVESPDPELILLEADATYEQVVEAYGSGKFICVKVPTDNEYLILPLMTIGNGQAVFGSSHIVEFILIMMGQDMGNYAIMESVDMEEALELQTRFNEIWETLHNKADESAIPDALADLTDDANHRTVTDTEKNTWNNKLDKSLKGAKNGIAELDSSGKVPSTQLPSYVDDVIEGTYISTTSFKDTNGTAVTGETGKIYVDTTSNKTYRWSGSAFAEISASLALGENSSTAYRGDRGKIAYDHSQITSGNPHGVTTQ